MRKIWYLKQEKGQKTKTAKLFLFDKDGHVEGRMDLSAFGNCGKEERKFLLLYMKDVSGKDVGKISLEEGTALYEGFLQGKGKLKEELADKLKTLKGEAVLSVALGKERYLSEGWIEQENVPVKSETEEKSVKTEDKGEKDKRKEDNKGKEDNRGKKEKLEKVNKKEKAGKQREKEEIKEKENAIEDLEAEELLSEEREEKRIVQLSVLEEELLFRSYVHNSFLLHGYYNYGHVMIDESGEEPRLGVPGNYYEREQMVAEMFGFPVFEAAREGEQIANGTFGYFYTKG